MNLDNIIRNSFENITASLDRKSMFLNNHYNRLKNNTINALLDGIIAETEVVKNKWFELISARKQADGISKSYTMQVNGLLADFSALARKIESAVIFKHEKFSLIYKECFPNGLKEYTNASQSEISNLLDYLTKFAVKYEASLGSEFVVKFKELKISWNEININRDASKQTLKDSSPDLEAYWEEVSIQLYKNALTILLACIDNRNKANSYYDFRIVNFIRHHQADNTDPDTYTLSLAPNTSKAADFVFAATDNLLIINNSNQAVYFYAAVAADAAQPAQLTEIAAGDELEIAATQLGAPANKFLIFVNKDSTQQAEVEIALI